MQKVSIANVFYVFSNPQLVPIGKISGSKMLENNISGKQKDDIYLSVILQAAYSGKLVIQSCSR